MILPVTVALWYCFAFVVIGFFMWGACHDLASVWWQRFWLWWMAFWFLPFGLRVIISALLG